MRTLSNSQEKYRLFKTTRKKSQIAKDNSNQSALFSAVFAPNERFNLVWKTPICIYEENTEDRDIEMFLRLVTNLGQKRNPKRSRTSDHQILRSDTLSLTLYILTSVYIFSILVSEGGGEKLFNRQELLWLGVISFILVILKCDSGVIL